MEFHVQLGTYNDNAAWKSCMSEVGKSYCLVLLLLRHSWVLGLKTQAQFYDMRYLVVVAFQDLQQKNYLLTEIISWC